MKKALNEKNETDFIEKYDELGNVIGLKDGNIIVS